MKESLDGDPKGSRKRRRDGREVPTTLDRRRGTTRRRRGRRAPHTKLKVRRPNTTLALGEETRHQAELEEGPSPQRVGEENPPTTRRRERRFHNPDRRRGKGKGSGGTRAVIRSALLNDGCLAVDRPTSPLQEALRRQRGCSSRLVGRTLIPHAWDLIRCDADRPTAREPARGAVALRRLSGLAISVRSPPNGSIAGTRRWRAGCSPTGRRCSIARTSARTRWLLAGPVRSFNIPSTVLPTT